MNLKYSIISYLIPDKEAIENKLHSRREKLRSLLKAEVNFFEVKTIQPFERFIQGLLNHLSESTSPVDFSSTGQFNYPVSENGFMQVLCFIFICKFAFKDSCTMLQSQTENNPDELSGGVRNVNVSMLNY